MEKYRPETFFDCHVPLFSGIFKNAEHVWDIIPLIPAYVSEHIQPGLHGFIEDGAWVDEENVQLDPGSRVERGAIVRGPSIIGRDTVIRSGAYIRGHVMIGSGCVIGNSTEIRQIILMDGSALPHKNDVFTSVIGSNVNLGGMVCTANYRLDGKEIMIRIDIDNEPKRLHTGLTHFGSIIGDGTSIGGQCMLQPGTIIGKRCKIYPMSLISGYIPADSVYGKRTAHKYEG